MAHGISINIGVREPGPDCCRKAALLGCEIDAQVMAEIARKAGFEVVPPLLGAGATWANLEAELAWAALRLKEGDILLVSFSGHGCRQRDPDCTEVDCLDESWCLADRQVLDDELHERWAEFAPGVRILVISDSCHSGTVHMVAASPAASGRDASRRLAASEAPRFVRPADLRLADSAHSDAAAAPAEARKHFRRNKANVQASVLLIAACEEKELSQDGARGGLFTTVLRHVWDGNRFPPTGTYKDFIDQIRSLVATSNPNQHPTWAWTGSFPVWREREKPFTI